MHNILITGATGFIGSHLTPFLAEKGYVILTCSRKQSDNIALKNKAIKHIQWDMEHEEPPTNLLENIDGIINLASCLNGSPKTVETINVFAAKKLFQVAQQATVKHFIQISTAKVFGETSDGDIFTEAHPCTPQTPYAKSKLEAEQCLQRLASSPDNQVQLTILRPPLVYGAGAKGNIAKLVKWIERGIPLPFASINNKRSFIAVENLCDALLTCLKQYKLSSGTFNVSDCHDISTPELIQLISLKTQKKARLLPFPGKILQKTFTALKGSGIADRLLGSFQLDSRLFCQRFAWQPPYDHRLKLAETGKWYEDVNKKLKM